MTHFESKTRLRDRYSYEDNRLFLNDRYIAVLESNLETDQICEHVAELLDDYGRLENEHQRSVATAEKLRVKLRDVDNIAREYLTQCTDYCESDVYFQEIRELTRNV